MAPSVFTPRCQAIPRKPNRTDQRNDEENATQIDPIENAINHIITKTRTNSQNQHPKTNTQRPTHEMLCQGHAASTNGGRADLVVKRYSAPEIAIDRRFDRKDRQGPSW